MAKRRKSAHREGALRRAAGEVQDAANSQRSWTHREGLLLRVEEGGLAGFGEASPLPDYSPDSLADAEADLRRWIEGGCGDSTQSIGSPSARFAAEVALLDLKAQHRSKPLWRVLAGSEAARSRPVQGLLPQGLPSEGLVQRARDLIGSGIQTFKLKVGPATEEEAARLDALRREFGDDIALRLDANRSLPIEDAMQTLEVWSEFGIEFIEEPCAGPGPIDSPIPLAFDETLKDPDMARGGWQQLRYWLKEAPYVALVVKPTVLGLGTTKDLARLAKRSHLNLVVSHTFEGPVALQACAHVALALGSDGACGLARHGGLDAWADADGLLVADDRVDPELSPGAGLGLDGESLWEAAGEGS